MSRASDYVESLSAKNGDLYTLSPWEGTELEGSAAEVYLTSEDFLQVAARQDANRYISNKLYDYLASSGARLPQFVISSVDYGFSEYEAVVENLNSTFDLVSLGKEPMLVAIRGYILDNYGENVKAFFMEMYTHLLCLSSATRLGIVPVLSAGNAMFEGAFVDLTVSKQGDSSQDGYFIDLMMLVYKVTWSSPENISGYTSASIEYTVDSLDGYVTFITKEKPNFDMIGVAPAPVDTTAANNSGTSAGSASATTSDAPVSTGLGSLSEKYEAASKGSNAIGYDENGGTSYGKYQISSKQGTMGEFIKWAEKNGGANGKEVAERLRAAGPSNTGGRGGTMPEVWNQLANEGKLGNMEHDFIKVSHYDVAYNKIKDPELRKKIDNSPTLQNVVWSTAVQHGQEGAPKILNTVKGSDSEADIIDSIYQKRTAKQPSDANRYAKEGKDAQKALEKEINSSTAA